MTLLTDKLEQLGFSENAEAAAYFTNLADQAGMHKGGAYTQTHVYEKDGTFVVLEQNIGDEDLGGLEATVKYPPVVVIDGPAGRVACSPDDIALVERLLTGTADKTG